MVGRIVQGVIQECCECEVADEPVVVLKSPPMKARKGVEDKTEMTCCLISGDGRRPKAPIGCEGVKYR